MAFLVSGKIEFLCLFATQDEVTGEKSSDLGGNYLGQIRLPKYGMLTSFVLPSQLQDSLKDVRRWQFLTMKATETLCIVCLPPEKHIS